MKDKNIMVKSPFNYIGGKYKILPDILKVFPDDISTLYDVFGGGANVCINTNAKHIYYNDIVGYIVDIFEGINDNEIEYILNEINSIISKYNLSKTNTSGFNKLRDDYNYGSNHWINLYVLICYSFNYQFRFNNKHKYNSSFGMNRSCFSKITENKIIKFKERLDKLDITFSKKDFREIDFNNANEKDLVYLDPPYLITIGNYNDGKRGFSGWSKQDDLDLMELCDELNSKNIRFAMSNVLENKGQSNDILKKWSRKYNVIHINNTYNNSNYQSKDKGMNTTDEVLITNYN